MTLDFSALSPFEKVYINFSFPFHMKKHASSYVNLISSNIILSDFSFRYFISAEDELDCNWLFMKGQEDDDASWFKWLKDELYVLINNHANVGAVHFEITKLHIF